MDDRVDGRADMPVRERPPNSIRDFNCNLQGSTGRLRCNGKSIQEPEAAIPGRGPGTSSKCCGARRWIRCSNATKGLPPNSA